DLKAGDDPEAVKLSDLYATMRSSKRNRIPILDENGAAVYVVHDSTIASFADSIKKDPADPATFTETMGDLVKDAGLGKAVRAMGFVGPNAVLAEARTAMRSVDGCNDVFITTAGQKGDAVVGWLTNTDLAGLE